MTKLCLLALPACPLNNIMPKLSHSLYSYVVSWDVFIKFRPHYYQGADECTRQQNITDDDIYIFYIKKKVLSLGCAVCYSADIVCHRVQHNISRSRLDEMICLLYNSALAFIGSCCCAPACWFCQAWCSQASPAHSKKGINEWDCHGCWSLGDIYSYFLRASCII